MKRVFLVVTVFSCLFLFSQSTSEVDFNLMQQSLKAMGPDFEGGTARYAGMAGSMGALGGDVSSININPAATGVFIKSTASFTLGYNNIEDKAILGNSHSNNNDQFGFNQLGTVIAFDTNNENWKTVNLAILYDRDDLDENIQFGSNHKLNSFDFNADNEIVDTYYMDGYEKDIRGKKEKITFGIGANFKNKLYLGANMNIHSYRLFYDNQYFGYYPELDETYNFYAFNYPYNEEGTGLSFGVGAIFRPISQVRLAAAYQSPIGWSEIATEYDEYYYNETTGLMENEVGLGFWDQDRASGAGMLSLGAGFVIKKQFALNLDFINRFNSNNKFKPRSEYVGTNNLLEQGVKDAQEFRIGGEYRFKKWRFRGGFSYAPSPMNDISLSDGYMDGEGISRTDGITNFILGDQQLIGAGLGYQFKNWELDLAYQHMNQEYQTLIYGTHVEPGFYPLYVPNMVGQIENTSQRFIVTAGFRF